MYRLPAAGAGLTAALVLVAAGCGGESGSSGGQTTPTSATSTAAASPQLTKPIRPTCGVAQFPAPVIQKAESKGIVTWTLRYQLGPSAPRIAGESSQITLSERAPDKGHLKGAVRIAGRDVRIVMKTKQSPFSFATWVTPRATYIALDDAAKAKTLRKLIGCLP